MRRCLSTRGNPSAQPVAVHLDQHHDKRAYEVSAGGQFRAAGGSPEPGGVVLISQATRERAPAVALPCEQVRRTVGVA